MYLSLYISYICSMDSAYFIPNESIHEVTVGTNPKTDIRYTVGRTYQVGKNSVTVTAIEFDQNALSTYGISRALIFAGTDNGEEVLWKVVENIPMIVTCKA